MSRIFCKEARTSRQSAPTSPRAPRFSRSPAKCAIPVSWRYPWEPRCARSSKTSAAGLPKEKRSLRCKPAGLRAASSHGNISIRRCPTNICRARFHHGLGRHDRDGRRRLPGRHRKVLSRLLRRRILRQVRAVQDRRISNAQDIGKNNRRQGPIEDLATLKRIALSMQKASLCALGQSAPNPVVSTIKHFEEEYREHIVDKKCRAGKCTKLFQFEIIDAACKRCRLCVVNCPVHCITGDREKGYVIDKAACIKCGKCFEVCKFEAVARR